MIIPHFMNIDTVHTHGEDSYAELLELSMLFGDRRNFCCSNKGKVAWIKTQDDPLSDILGEFNLDELAFVIRGG